MIRTAGGIWVEGFERLASFVEAKEEEGSEEEDKDLKAVLVNLLKENPDPEDVDIHEWAEENGYDIDKVETLLYELATDYVEENDPESEDLIPGGKADDAEESDFPMEQLLKGIKVEMEHTDDPDVAEEIAKDHLSEFPDADYYEALEGMEDELKKKEE